MNERRVAFLGAADGVAAMAAAIHQHLRLPSLSRTTMTRSSPIKVMKKSPGLGICDSWHMKIQARAKICSISSS